MDFLIKFVGAMILLSVFVLPHRWAQLWRWLKGSRKHYILRDGHVRECDLGMLNYGTDTQVEITEWLFWKWGRVYGKNSARWNIRYVRDNPMVAGSYELLLEDRGRQSIKTVLCVVNTALSFPALLDRIAELEKKLQEAELEKSEWAAGMEALRRRIMDNKQRFRSPAAKAIRENIEEAFREMPAIKIDEHIVEKWLAFFEGRVHEEHPCDR